MGEVLADGRVSKIFNFSIHSFIIKSLKGVKYLACHLWNGIYKEQTKMMIQQGVINEEREPDKNSPELPGIRETNVILFEINIQVLASKDLRQRPPEIRRRITRLRQTSRITSAGSECMRRTGQQLFR